MSKDMKHEAKRNMLQELKKMASGMLGDDLKGKMSGMKKITVAGKDDDSLKAGLKTAEGILGKDTDKDPDKTDQKAKDEVKAAGSEPDIEDDMSEESPEEESQEDDAMSPDELQTKIKELQDKLNSLKK